MYPEIVKIPLIGMPINSYGFMIMLGFIAALFVGVRRAKQIGISSELIMDVGIYSMICGIVGGKITYLLTFYSEYDWNIFNVCDGNMVPLGFIAGAIPLFALSSYWRGGGFFALVGNTRWLALASFIMGGWVLLWGCFAGAPLSVIVGCLVLCGIVFLAAYLLRSCRDGGEGGAHGSSKWKIIVLAFLVAIAAVLGARVLYLLGESSAYSWNVITSWNSGFVFYGGAISGILVGVLIVRARGAGVLKVADLAAPCIMLGLAFGRIGCFLNGCCYGLTGDFPLAVPFPPASLPYKIQLRAHQIQEGAESSLPVHPTQIYESLVAFGLFLFLSHLWEKKKKDGFVLAVLGVTYPLWRFVVEFIRGDNDPFWFGVLTFSQGVSVILFVACAIWLKKKYMRKDLTSSGSEVQ